jgi:hypothetical protein
MGAVAVIEVLETTFQVVAGTPPTVTAVAPRKSVPVIVTVVVPLVLTLLGLTPVTVGAAAAT